MNDIKMDKKDFFCFGKIIKPHGVKNKFQAILNTNKSEHFENIEIIFVEIDKTLIPYFINNIQISGKQAIIELLDVDFDTITNLLVGLSIFLPNELLPKLPENEFHSHEVEGFTVHDKEKGNIGIIEEVLDMEYQEIFKINFNDKEILIPVVEDIVKKIDRKNRRIDIEAPDGLIDIYL